MTNRQHFTNTLAGILLRQQTPGPYACFDDHEGCDSTITVVCLKTETRLISTYYWEEREGALRCATAVAAALNRAAGYTEFVDTLGDVRSTSFNLKEFFRVYNEPFKARRADCPYHGPYWEVVAGNKFVIHRVNWDSMRQTKLVAMAVAHALSELRQSLQLESDQVLAGEV